MVVVVSVSDLFLLPPTQHFTYDFSFTFFFCSIFYLIISSSRRPRRKTCVGGGGKTCGRVGTGPAGRWRQDVRRSSGVDGLR